MSFTDAMEFIGLPVLLACAILIQGWWSGPRPWHAKPPAWPFPLALGLAFILAFVLQEGWPTWPPTQRWHWLVPGVAACTLLGATARLFPLRGRLRFTPEIVIAFITFSLRFPDASEITPLDRLLLGVGVLLAAAAGRAAVLRRPAIQLPVLGWLLLATLSVLILQANFAKLAIITGAISAACAGLAVLTLLRRPSSLGIGAHLMIGFLVPVLATYGMAYDASDRIPTGAWILVVLALPLTVVARALVPTRRALATVLVSMGVVATCCLIALIWTWAVAPPPAEPYL
ncbi:MAG: hypothetical protein MK095_02435 [Phycisphaerales bacterium]|jgi:hypothetical protein|nr:hypothetical protein [Phycisphaerales bacterium]